MSLNEHISLICLDRLEGHEAHSQHIDLFLAEGWLFWQVRTYPPNGTDKCKMQVHFFNGMEACFNLDLSSQGILLEPFILKQISIYAGLKKPGCFTDEQYAELIKNIGDGWQHLAQALNLKGPANE